MTQTAFSEFQTDRSNNQRQLALYASAIALLASLTALLLIHAQRYHPFISDDALISLRYAQRLLEGHGLTWTDGPRVEGYSNLLWVLMVSALGGLRLDLIDSARYLGYLGMSLTTAAIVWYQVVRGGWFGLLPAGIGGLFVVLSGPVAVWAIGGLEQPAVAALLAWAIVLIFRSLDMPESIIPVLVASLCLGLLCITRPDGPLFTAAIALALFLDQGINRTSMRFVVMISLLPMIFFGGQLLFRFIYYDAWVPNTAFVKISPSDQHLRDGWIYVTDGLMALNPLTWWAFVAIVALIFYGQTRTRGLILALTAGLWLAYVVFIGGDIFPAWRHMVPVIAVFAIALAEGCWVFWTNVSSRYVRGVLILALLISFVAFVSGQRSNEQNQRAVHERWEWDGEVIGLLLKEAFGDEQPLFAVSAAGTLPYFSELPVVDMYGLSDAYIARHPPEDFGEGRIGHELGNGAYVLSREPDLVSFCGPAGRHRACSRSGKEMSKTDEFAREYIPVNFKGFTPYEFTGMIWVRKYSDRIGIQVSDDSVRIPGYLLVEDSEHSAYLDETGALVAAIPLDGALAITLRDLPAGVWQATIDSQHADEIAYSIERLQNGATELTVRANGQNRPEVREIVLRRVD